MQLYKQTGLATDHSVNGNLYRTTEPATLSDLKAALAEHGMVAVPVEPTHEMIEAGGRAISECFFARYESTRAVTSYRAMIEAAQKESSGED
jgi:hypothetical protein